MKPDNHILKIVEEIKNGIRFEKCRKCGCQSGTVLAIEKMLPKLREEDRALLRPVIEEARATFQEKEYDCLGCKMCFPAAAINELLKAYPDLAQEAVEDVCAGDIEAREREGWPPLPGNYKVFRYHAPVAVCTLNSRDLISQLAAASHDGISIVGSLNTENLGIERIIKNVVSNPNIRFLILCGEDSEQKVGHLPGQSLISLFQNGVDENKRIIGAKGSRPVLKNMYRDLISRFLKQIRHVDMIGCSGIPDILEKASACARENPMAYLIGGSLKIEVPKIEARPPRPLQIDPNGYFVIFPVPERDCMVAEHYKNDGTLDAVIEGKEISYIYMTAIEMGLLSQLDHACYLGKELERATNSLRTGIPYEQDKAQDAPEKFADKKTMSCKVAACC